MRRWIALLVPLMIGATLLVLSNLVLRLADLRIVPLIIFSFLVVGTAAGAILTRHNPRWGRVLVVVLWALAVIDVLFGAILYALFFMLARSMR